MCATLSFSHLVDGLAEIDTLGWDWFHVIWGGISPLFFSFQWGSNKCDVIHSLNPFRIFSLPSLVSEFSWRYHLLRILFHSQCWYEVMGHLDQGIHALKSGKYSCIISWDNFSLSLFFSLLLFLSLSLVLLPSLPSFHFPVFLSWKSYSLNVWLPYGICNMLVSVLFYNAYSCFFLSRDLVNFLSDLVEF